jgi:hypothetical protein
MTEVHEQRCSIWLKADGRLADGLTTTPQLDRRHTCE